MNPTRSLTSHAKKSKRLAAQWAELCSKYLPVAPDASVWRYSREPRAGEPEQGWKLHLSATLLNACRVLEKVGPVLVGADVSFKAPASLEEVRLINSGLRYAYSQVGKIITVYPRDSEEAVSLARRLHELTRRTHAPAVPFDLRYRPGSNVYYRYGAFRSRELETPEGARAPAMRDPWGNLVPDLREPGRAKPVWVEDPFAVRRKRRAKLRTPTPLHTTFRAFRALSQRGKGGVYQAVDLSAEPPRLCLLKEGRRWGEVSWDGRDGRRRVMREARCLALLGERGLDVPRVYASFEAEGNFYLVTEFIDGESLQSFLFKRRRRLSVARVLAYAVQLSDYVARIHDAGIVWGDCKPTNLIVTKRGCLRPLDFEGAQHADSPDALPWMTQAFTPPRVRVRPRARSRFYGDLYALGAVVYLLLTGRMPEASMALTPARALRPNTPREVCELVSLLLDPGGRAVPDARAVSRRLKAVLSEMSGVSAGGSVRRRPAAASARAAGG